jgi:hypothetical protein
VIAAGIVALAALLIFINAVATARRGQKAAYYSVRREAQRSANRSLQLSFLALLLGAGMYVASLFVPRDGPAVATAPTPTLTPAATVAHDKVPAATAAVTPAPSATSAPTRSPTATPSPAPTAAPGATSTAKATPIPEPTSALSVTTIVTTAQQSPLPTPGPAAPNKRLTLVGIGTAVDTANAPIDASTTFSAGIKSIFIAFDYRDVPPSALLRHSWFRDGGTIYYWSQRFPEQEAIGRASVSWSPAGGFRPGLYEVRIQLGGVPQFVANFEVK